MVDEPLTEVLPPEGPATTERMWPLDVSLAVLGGLAVYTISTRLRADDPRPLHNPWTYAVAVPLVVVALSLVLRNVASRFVRRSLQLGFLLSILVHLLMLIAFFNVMILAPFWPSATSGREPIRAPLRKTVPDYLFTRSDLPQRQPDWSRPVDAETSSRALPEQPRVLPPVDSTAERLEMPQQQPREVTEERPFLVPRPQHEAAMPTPSSSAAELSRQDLRHEPTIHSSIEIPDVPTAPSAAARAVERPSETLELRQTSSAALAERNLAESAAKSAQLPQYAPKIAADPPRVERRPDRTLPRVGDLAADVARQSRRLPDVGATPAGASPAAPSLKIARLSEDADRVLSDRSTPWTAPRSSAGANPTPLDQAGISAAQLDPGHSLVAPLARSERASSGSPEISAQMPSAADPRTGRTRDLRSLPPGTLGAPDISGLRIATAATGNEGEAAAPGSTALDRGPRLEMTQRRAAGAAQGSGAALGPPEVSPNNAQPPAASIDLAVPVGPGGLSADPARRVGFAAADQVPEIAAIDFARPTPRRRDLGGPTAPAGAEIAGLRPFDRRAMRTSGGAAPTPAGMVGPEVEEAIERGLAYLAERQNADGGWSLQGHGEEVLLRSDTAATGLCLLAFQGAGYTHQQHQYASTVARGLDFLVANQRSNGDLFRPEDAASNRNAWLYSHGIAALALCEAYGMTRDEALRDKAQRSIDFIAYSQNPRLGGWRYEPRISSDTSVTGWMMMALKSGELSGLDVSPKTYQGIERWVDDAQEADNRGARYRYNPFAPDTPEQRHGRRVTPTMTAVGLLARLYLGSERSQPEIQRGADYLAQFPPTMGTPIDPRRDTYYWYYATQVMFHMGGEHWEQWNSRLNPLLVTSQLRSGPDAGSWDPKLPIADRWGPHAGRLYVTAMNLLSLEVYYRHLPIYVETGK